MNSRRKEPLTATGPHVTRGLPKGSAQPSFVTRSVAPRPMSGAPTNPKPRRQARSDEERDRLLTSAVGDQSETKYAWGVTLFLIAAPWVLIGVLLS